MEPKESAEPVTTRCAVLWTNRAPRSPRSSLLTQPVSSILPHYSLCTHRTEYKIIASAVPVASFSFSSSACRVPELQIRHFEGLPSFIQEQIPATEFPPFHFMLHQIDCHKQHIVWCGDNVILSILWWQWLVRKNTRNIIDKTALFMVLKALQDKTLKIKF